jgi:hypothetical protein
VAAVSNPSSTAFFVVDQYRQVQPTGNVTVANDGSYSFTVELQASRDGNDPNGRRYAITLNAQDNAGNSSSATANVTVPTTPVEYRGEGQGRDRRTLWATVRLSTLLTVALTGVFGGIARAELTADATPSETGSTGLYRMSTVDGVGAPAIRLAAFGELSRSTNLLVLNDVDTRVITHLVAAADVLRRAQVFASLSFSFNRDEQPIPNAPSIVQTAFVPDLFLGAKAVAWRNDIFAVGGELGARVPLGGSVLPEAISGWADVLGSARLWSGQRSSLRAHVSIGYYFDNGQKQLDVNNPSESDIELFMFAHAAGTDRVREVLGLEGAFQGQKLPRLRAFVELHQEMAEGAPNDRLLTEPMLRDTQQWVTIGLNVGIGSRVTIEAGVDVAIQSSGIAFEPPLPSFGLWAGATVQLETARSGER